MPQIQLDRSMRTRTLPRGRLPPQSVWAGNPNAPKAISNIGEIVETDNLEPQQMTNDQGSAEWLGQLRDLARGFLSWLSEEGTEGHHPPDVAQHQQALLQGPQQADVNEPPTYPNQASGTLLMAPDGRALFVRRNGTGDRGGTWSIPGGMSTGDELPWQTALRETKEEVGDINLTADDLQLLDHHTNSNNGVGFTTYGAKVQDAFEPMLNHEHDDYKWATLRDAPEPLHPGLKATMDFAMDPLTAKGEKIMSAMQKFYGPEKGKKVFYASSNKGNIWGVRTPSAHWPTRSPGARRSALRAAAVARHKRGDESFDDDFDYDAEPQPIVQSTGRPETNIEQPDESYTPFGASTDASVQYQRPAIQRARSLDDASEGVMTSPGETRTDPHTWPWESSPWKPPVKDADWDSPNWSWERTQKRTYPDGSTDTATFKVSPQQAKAAAAGAGPMQQTVPMQGAPQQQQQAQRPQTQMPRPQPTQPQPMHAQPPPADPAKRPTPAQMPAQTDANGVGIRSAYEQGRAETAHAGGLRDVYRQGLARRRDQTWDAGDYSQVGDNTSVLIGEPTRILQGRTGDKWDSPSFAARAYTKDASQSRGGYLPSSDAEERDRKKSGLMGQMERSRRTRTLPRGRLPPQSVSPGNVQSSNSNA